MDLSWNTIAAQFPVNDRLTWLNNAGTTPSGSFVSDDITKFIRSYSEYGVFQKDFTSAAVVRGIRETLGTLLGAPASDVAVTHNTAEGMNFISHGLRLLPGDEILLLENEYPSNIYPWEHWKKKGVALTFVPAGTTPDEFFRNFQNAVTRHTKVAALSAVHWCTGLPLPLKRIAEFCRNENIELAVDAAQGAGHIGIDMNWGISFLALSGWKWLLGPLGIGALVVRRDKLDLLDPVFKGSDSVPDERNYLPYREEYKPDAERYMYSTGSFLDRVAFRSSLSFLDGIGFPAVMNRIHELAALASRTLQRHGWTVLCSRYEEPTGIVVAEKQGLDAQDAVRKLKERGVIIQERLGRVRISPHVYITEEKLLEAISFLTTLY